EQQRHRIAWQAVAAIALIGTAGIRPHLVGQRQNVLEEPPGRNNRLQRSQFPPVAFRILLFKIPSAVVDVVWLDRQGLLRAVAAVVRLRGKYRLPGELQRALLLTRLLAILVFLADALEQGVLRLQAENDIRPRRLKLDVDVERLLLFRRRTTGCRSGKR